MLQTPTLNTQHHDYIHLPTDIHLSTLYPPDLPTPPRKPRLLLPTRIISAPGTPQPQLHTRRPLFANPHFAQVLRRDIGEGTDEYGRFVERL